MEYFKTGLISVIMPCFNQEKFIKESFFSVLKQSYTNWELIIINDGSTDNSDHEINKLKQEYPDRITYLKTENLGVSSARNTGLAKAQGEYIQFLDADDIIDPMKFELSVKILQENNSDIVISNYNMFKENLNKLLPAYYPLKPQFFSYDEILLKWGIDFTIPIHCPVFKRTLLNNFSFNLNLKAQEDWVMWLYIFSQGIQVDYIEQPLTFYRMSQGSATSNYNLMLTNTGKAFKYIYSNLNEEYRSKFFHRIVDENESNIISLRNTKTFKIGDMIVKSLKKIIGWRN